MSDYITRERNLTLLTDYYEYTMVNGYFHAGIQEKIAVFDVFFRRVPENGGFAIYAGLQQIIELINGLSFTEEDIEYFRKKGCFSEKFFNFLRNFKFRCDVWSIKEGTPIFPNEPIITVRGPLEQVQMVETMLLVTFNFETLIATKASRLIRAAQGRAIVEFGSRRAQGYDGAMLGARAAYIAGCAGTACTISDRMMGVPASGTMAHSWVQAFENEYEAFKAYAETYPDNCCLLVDTYNVLKSGVPNAIRVFNEVVLPKGFRPKSIRLDSGDLAYLSKKARKMLDDAGFPDVKIMASNSLDEYIIRDLLLQDAKLDSFGVGENLITSKNEPVFGGVYKLVAIENDNGELIPKIKLSETAQKITTPGFKEVYRFYGRDNGKAWRITSCWLAKKWMTPSPLPSSIPMTFGRKRPSPISVPKSSRCRSLRRVFSATRRLRWRRSAATVPPRWIPCGMRSSALSTPTPIMSIFLKNCGRPSSA